MPVYENSLDGNNQQQHAIDEATRTVQFIRNQQICQFVSSQSEPSSTSPQAP